MIYHFHPQLADHKILDSIGLPATSSREERPPSFFPRCEREYEHISYITRQQQDTSPFPAEAYPQHPSRLSG